LPGLLENRDEWFSYWDDSDNGGNGNEQLSPKQLVHAFRRTFPSFDKETVESAVHETWRSFDVLNSGLLDKETLMKSQAGLVDTAHMVMLWSA